MMTKMIELNRELLLDELSNFEQKRSGEIPVILNKYLESIAQNGDTMFSWYKLQPLLKRKLEIVMNEFHELCPTDNLIPLPNVRPFDFEELKQQILSSIDSFNSAPFTIQRLCELIINPSKHYKRTDKFLRGIEKNILVVTTIQPKSADGSSTQYATSSFKNLFSALHSSVNSSSLLVPSTSLLVNGIADAMCDQQMAIHESGLHPMSSPVSPTSIPLSTPSSNSPPNPHLAPLQQLDSFTTVFASTPSTTPLSVVSDLHSYEHSSNLSLMTATTSGEIVISSISSELKTTTSTESSADFKTSSETDSTISSSNDTNDSDSVESDSSTEVVNEIKVEVTESSLKLDSIETKPTDSNETNNKPEVDKQLSETSSDESNNSIKDQTKDNLKTEEIVSNEQNISLSLTQDLNKSDENITENNETVKIDITSDPNIGSDIDLKTDDKTPVEDPVNEPPNDNSSESLDNNEMGITADEEMSQPMDNSNLTNAMIDNNTDMADCSDRPIETTPESNLMDDSQSQSDQSEPMDED